MLEKYQEEINASEIVSAIQKKSGCTRKQAEAIMRKEIPLEKFYQRKVLEALQHYYPDAFVQKITLSQYSQGGLPDILCIIEGHYFGFEIKRPVLGSTSRLQEAAIDRIRKAGGTAEVVSYPEEALKIIREYLRECFYTEVEK